MTKPTGRPVGRPKGAVSLEKRALAEMAKELAPLALDTLRDVMADTEAQHSARVAAANAILDRAYGKPPQAIEAKGNLTVTIASADADFT